MKMCASMRCFVLMEDGPDRQIAFEVLERLLDVDELQIELPELGRVGFGEIGAQQIAPFAAADLSQLVAIEPIGEACTALGRPRHRSAARRPAPWSARAELHQQFIARELHGAQFLEPRPQPFQLPPAHRALLGDPIVALGEDVELAVLRAAA